MGTFLRNFVVSAGIFSVSFVVVVDVSVIAIQIVGLILLLVLLCHKPNDESYSNRN